jgi:hypothetical protein
MKIRSYSILALWFCLTPPLLAAQQSSGAPDAAASASSDAKSVPVAPVTGVTAWNPGETAEDTSLDLPQLPTLLGGRETSLAFTSELERSNYLRGGVNVGAAYDDNALLAPSAPLSNTSFSVFPNLDLELTRPRMRWDLGYAGGLTVNEELASRDQGSQDVSLDSLFRLTPHVSLRLAEHFSLTTGVFDAAGNGALPAGPSSETNSYLFTPLATQRSSLTTAQTTYHFAPNDLTGVSGSFYALHFSDTPTSGTLVDTRSASGVAFWLHRLFRKDWAGLTYRFQRLVFDPGDAGTRVQSALVVNTLTVRDRFSFTVFAGPQYSVSEGVAGSVPPVATAQTTGTSAAGGAELGWHAPRTTVTAGVSRGISDGGGILGAVRLLSVHAEARQELIAGWAFGLGGSHGVSQPLVPLDGGPNSVHTTSVNASVERNLGKSLGFQMGYSHDLQQQLGLADPALQGLAHRNRYFVTLNYQWSKPLGM